MAGVKTMLTPSQMQMQMQQQGNLAGVQKMPMAKMKMMVGKMPLSLHHPMPSKFPPSALASSFSSSTPVALPNKMMMIPSQPPIPGVLAPQSAL